jgi:acyl-CoA synthetase (AMP-forming)/AMP-acid ligase II
MNASEKINKAFSIHWIKPALITDERSFSYCDLYAHANAIRAWLLNQGCQIDDTVAIRLPNGWPFAVAYLACILGGYRFVPVNPELNEVDQDYILCRVNARIVIEDEAVLYGLLPILADAPNFNYPKGKVAAVFFTSGTTGKPKGVCHTLEGLVGNVVAFNQSQGLDSDTRLYHVLPMAYMAGFLNTLLSPWLAGGTVLLGPRFRPVEALQFWKRPLAWDANAIWLTPTLATVLVRMNRDLDIKHKLSESMRHIFCGTAPLPIAVRQSFHATFSCSLQESYGMSEVLLVAAQTRVEAAEQINVGHLLPGVHATFRAIPERREPELVINTPYALSSYLLEDGESSPLLGDGGMPTGDAGQMEGDALIITGRLKDLIIRGGLNVTPVAVENVLKRELGIQEVAVVGLPHDIWGESIVACLVAESGRNVDTLQANLHLRCTKELAEGMRPDRYVWLEDLPHASTGKVQKHVLIERFT